MNAMWMAWLLLVVPAQVDEAPTADPASERIRVLAVHGQNAGRETPDYDPSLASVMPFLADLPYDTFRERAFFDESLPYGEVAVVELSPDYTLHCRPDTYTEEGEVELEAWITMARGGTKVEALRVRARAERGGGMVFRGFDMAPGELIVMLSVAQASPEGEGGGSSAGNAGQQSGASSEGASKQGEGMSARDGGGEPPSPDDEANPVVGARQADGEDDPAVAERAPEESEETADLPTDLANLEGILRALEEVDRREQAASRRQRGDRKIRGAWW